MTIAATPFAAPGAHDRDGLTLGPFVVLAWLLLLVFCSLLVLTGEGWPNPRGPDDAMRLVQVRDWLGGQGWFDTTQYRMGGPDGTPMPWSRLVDLPIAASIAILTPPLGVGLAETVTLHVVPALTLLLCLSVLGRVARQLGGVSLAAVAMLMVIGMPMAFNQLTLTRIDHHGWQFVLGLVALLGALDRRAIRGALTAGMAMAVWLHISLEGLPFAGALAAALALRALLRDGWETRRLSAYLAALTLGSVVLIGTMRAPAEWFVQWCDTVGYAHIGAFASSLAASSLLLLPFARHTVSRIATLGGVGAAGLAGFVYLLPELCRAGPFATLDPLVAEHWYQQVAEGLPVWNFDASEQSSLYLALLMGILGAARSAWLTSGDKRLDWLTLLVALVGASAVGLLVSRAIGFALLLATPGIATLSIAAFRWAQSIQTASARLPATLAALFFATTPGQLWAFAMFSDLTKTKADVAVDVAMDAVPRWHGVAQALADLPRQHILTSHDAGQAILLHTEHSILASGYHRAAEPLRQSLLAFTGDADAARANVERNGVTMIVMGADAMTLRTVTALAPNGFAARLMAGDTPCWLVPAPVALPATGSVQAWLVNSNACGASE